MHATGSQPFWLAIRSVGAVALLLLAVTLSGCDEGPPEEPTVWPWETRVVAAERFIRAHHAFDLALVNDFARYATNVINMAPIDASYFRRIKNYKPRTWKPLYIFTESLEGAYLSEQDKTYLKRVQDLLEKEYQAKVKEINHQLGGLHHAKEPNDYFLSTDALSADFWSMPGLVRAVESTTVEDLKSFSLALRRAMETKAIDASIISAFFRRPANYRELYEQNSKAIADAAFDAAENFLKAMTGPRKPAVNVERSLRLFLATDAIFGLEGYESAVLARKGVYAAIGYASHDKFRRELREALIEAALPPS
jgi:hypothetical protein